MCIARFRFWAKAGLRGGEEELGPDLEDRPIEYRSNNLGRERSGEGGEEESRVPDSSTRARGSTGHVPIGKAGPCWPGPSLHIALQLSFGSISGSLSGCDIKNAVSPSLPPLFSSPAQVRTPF